MRRSSHILRNFIPLIGLISLLALTYPILPTTPFDYVNLNLPAHFSAQSPISPAVTDFDNTPINNPLTDDGATLGRVLFYDKNLSLNNTVSCGSCHLQEFAFSDTATHSLGFNGGHTRRHSMTIVNARWFWGGKMFWDTRAASLEDQTLMPFQDTVEMGLTLPILIQRVQQETYYPALFSSAFGDTVVTSDRIAKALAQFIRSIVSYSSKYDVGRAQVNSSTVAFPNFSTVENQGKSIFFSAAGHCSNCHKSDAFLLTPSGPVCNGIDLVSTTDLGLYETTNNSGDIGKFKVPTLRNIELTAPYMHDGRFSTLEEVVDHYSTGIQFHMNLPPGLIDTVTGQPAAIQLNFTTAEKASLVAFLKTLTDTTLATEVKWSDPFTLKTSLANNQTANISFVIYPNPASHTISIVTNEQFNNRVLEIEILTLEGKQIYDNKKFVKPISSIDISTFPEGVYFLRIKIDGKSMVQRFVKNSQ
ncbi:MAG: cytochrome c peroxidase [Bacteroidia bacterium]